MRRYLITAVLVAIVVVAVRFASIIYDSNTPVQFQVQPLRADARTLSRGDVERVLSKQFRVFWRVQQMPSVLRQSLSLVQHEPFAMVNWRERMSTDVIVPGVPNKRLVFAGVSDDAAVVVYEVGGFIGTLNAAVFSYSNGGGVWGAVLEEHNARDLESLRKAVQSGEFKTWESLAEPGRVSPKEIGRGARD